MSYNYPNIRATAERLIARFGQAGTIVRVTNSGDAWSPTQSEESHAVTLVDLDYSDVAVDGTLIKRTDRMVYVSTAGVTITPGIADKITIGGVAHEVVTVKPLSPGGVVVLWEIQARA